MFGINIFGELLHDDLPIVSCGSHRQAGSLGHTFELFGTGVPLLGVRVKLRSLCRRVLRPALRVLVRLLVGLLSRPPLNPLRRPTRAPRADGVRLGVLERSPDRGDIERRGDDRALEGVCDLATAEVCCCERERPRSGDTEGMGRGLEDERITTGDSKYSMSA